jgi:uncharacterized protein YjbI with pentapeptide repeats
VSDSVWSCKEEFGSACKGLPADKELEGKLYCVLHFPSVNKDLGMFEEAVKKKLSEKDFNFRSVYFPREADFLRTSFEKTADFSSATFNKGADFRKAIFEEEVTFTQATFGKEVTFRQGGPFSGATFKGEADFSAATFERTAGFSSATFNKRADFRSATFEKRADFRRATFEGWAHYSEATFGEETDFFDATFKKRAFFTDAAFKKRADFSGATFEGAAALSRATFESRADFLAATFKEGAMFWSLQLSPQAFLRFRTAIIEKPERVSFHTTPLRPSYFVDVDAQKFDFSDVQWFSAHNGGELKLEDEIKALEDAWDDINPPSSLRKLQKSCRQLMNNAEENRDYSTANQFHYWSMELLRKESLRRLGLVGTFYWLLSGYGERPRRAFLVLVGMGTLFAIFYVMVAGSIEHVGEAFLYSLAAMVRLTGVPAMAPLTKLLQPSEPGLFQFLVTAEGILGPLQIALLALAIRRQVMR